MEVHNRDESEMTWIDPYRGRPIKTEEREIGDADRSYQVYWFYPFSCNSVPFPFQLLMPQAGSWGVQKATLSSWQFACHRDLIRFFAPFMRAGS